MQVVTVSRQHLEYLASATPQPVIYLLRCLKRAWGVGANNGRQLMQQLGGPIPPEKGDLRKLEFLDLGDNGFDGPIPPEMGNRTRLFYLAIGKGISGEIPAELGNLARLEQMVLDDTNLSGPLPVSLMDLNLRALTYFNNRGLRTGR